MNFPVYSSCFNICLYLLRYYIHVTDDYLSKISVVIFLKASTVSPTILLQSQYRYRAIWFCPYRSALCGFDLQLNIKPTLKKTLWYISCIATLMWVLVHIAQHCLLVICTHEKQISCCMGNDFFLNKWNFLFLVSSTNCLSHERRNYWSINIFIIKIWRWVFSVTVQL